MNALCPVAYPQMQEAEHIAAHEDTAYHRAEHCQQNERGQYGLRERGRPEMASYAGQAGFSAT